MSVYIKGMEMPTSCMLCPFCVEEADPANGEMCMVTGTLMPPCTRERLDNCPLIPVPEHGDLIDRETTRGKIGHLADEIDNKLGYEKSAPYIMMTLYLNNVDDFPTIIPAEEGE